jgi:hypothetical protein
MNKRARYAYLLTLAAAVALLALLAACGGAEQSGTPTLFYRGVG